MRGNTPFVPSWQSVAMILLVSAADEASPADFGRSIIQLYVLNCQIYHWRLIVNKKQLRHG